MAERRGSEMHDGNIEKHACEVKNPGADERIYPGGGSFRRTLEAGDAEEFSGIRVDTPPFAEYILTMNGRSGRSPGRGVPVTLAFPCGARS